MTTHEKFMNRCLELAIKGAGNVSPNPMVGCVIVKNGKVIAEGFHRKYGSDHAERNAIKSALKKKINLKGSTLYVNLEPCAHFGLTPPCADLIIEHKISKVVIGCKDPYHEVAGKGIKKLKRAGIEVITGILEEESKDINKFFFKFVTTGMPYVMIKAAQTLDGKIADINYRSKWISSPESRKLVHRLRAVYDAVLVGSNTVNCDNPELTVRDANGRDPVRVVLDNDLSSNLKSKLYTKRLIGRTVVMTSKNVNKAKINKFLKAGIVVIPCRSLNGRIDLKDVLKKLAGLDIQSVMVEGGAQTYSGFISQKLVDEFMVFTSPKIMGSGIAAFTKPVDFYKFGKVNFYRSGSDILLNIKKTQ
jgi:diaminohydroxyphosphoribosylaminopyrimidine deaminase / 5-amino-6-(5-phosphoribosylamino)uracil reductase